MGVLKKSVASFRIFGKTRDQQFDPKEITELLGVAPTRSHAIGDLNERYFNRTGQRHFRDFAKWIVSVEYRTPGDLNSQIKELIAMLPDDPNIWRQLHKDYELTVFCGLWLECFNSGQPLDSETLRLLSDRNLCLDLDIYQDPDYIHDEDEETLEFWKQVDVNSKRLTNKDAE